MTLSDLKGRLIAEGYRALLYPIGDWALDLSDLRIAAADGRFTVAWMERGHATDTLVSSADEGEACRRFHEVVSELWLHLRTFLSAGEADRLTVSLESLGIAVWRNDIPNFNGSGDARYRAFVHGRDLARAGLIAASAETGATATAWTT